MNEEVAKKPLRRYEEDFVARAKDFAVLGLEPIQIAERMELCGKRREEFLHDAADPKHPLHLLLFEARQRGDDDLDAALMTAACSGDIDALDLAYKVNQMRTYEQVRKELFGI